MARRVILKLEITFALDGITISEGLTGWWLFLEGLPEQDVMTFLSAVRQKPFSYIGGFLGQHCLLQLDRSKTEVTPARE